MDGDPDEETEEQDPAGLTISPGPAGQGAVPGTTSTTILFASSFLNVR